MTVGASSLLPCSGATLRGAARLLSPLDGIKIKLIVINKPNLMVKATFLLSTENNLTAEVTQGQLDFPRKDLQPEIHFF